MSTTRVEVVTDVAAFDAIGAEWNALLQASGSDTVFLTSEWLSAWASRLGADRRLHVLLVRRGGELIGAAPLAWRRRRLLGWLGVPCLEFLGTGIVGSDYLDVIVRRGFEGEAEAALVGALRRVRAMVEFAQLAAGRSVAAGVAAALTRSGWSRETRPVDVCPYIDLRGRDWDSYLASLGGEHRYAFRRKLRRLSARGFEFRRAASEDERRVALDTLVALHNRRWESRGGSDAFGGEVVAFHHDFTRRALGRGWLRLYVLSSGDRPLAALYGLRYGGTFSFYQSGFDPEAARDGAGTVCMGLAIQSALQEGTSEYDFLHGDEPYKFHWARDVRRLERVASFPPHAAGALWKGAAHIERETRRMARRVLPESVVRRLQSVRRERERRNEPATAEG